MKKFLGILVLGLLVCNVGFAGGLIKIPVHVHIIDLSEKGLPTKIKERDIKEDFKKVNKMLVKGLDTVRSSFPAAMRVMLNKLLEDILMNVPKEKLDKFIINFKNSMKLMELIR